MNEQTKPVSLCIYHTSKNKTFCKTLLTISRNNLGNATLSIQPENENASSKLLSSNIWNSHN